MGFTLRRCPRRPKMPSISGGHLREVRASSEHRGMDLPLLRINLTARCAEFAIALLGEPNRAMSSKRELRFGRHGSLAVGIAGPKVGLWRGPVGGAAGEAVAPTLR